jgi:hypothetical protein
LRSSRSSRPDLSNLQSRAGQWAALFFARPAAYGRYQDFITFTPQSVCRLLLIDRDMCIKRDVFSQMMAKYPELNYLPDGPPNPQAHLHWLFFDCMVDPDDGRYLSEDYAFCSRWRDIGGKIWVDLQCKLLHLGQHNFRGDFAESLRLQGRW